MSTNQNLKIALKVSCIVFFGVGIGSIDGRRTSECFD
jgi:hypothetical protein